MTNGPTPGQAQRPPQQVQTHSGPAAVAAQPREIPIPFTITHPAQNPGEHWFNGFFYGDPGHGKTSIAGTADDVPEMRDVLYFDAEQGDMVLADRPHLDVIKSKKYAVLARVHEFLRLHCRLRDEFLAGNQEAGEKLLNLQERLGVARGADPKLWRTFVVDTLTEVNQQLMYQLLQIDPDRWALDAVPSGAEWSEWKQGSDMTLILLRQLRDLPMHIIVTAHTLENEVTKPGIGRVNEKRPSLPGKLPNKIPGFWDMYGFMQKSKDSEGGDRFRLWLTDGQGDAWKAKHRMKFVNVQYVDNPTIPKLFDLMTQEWAQADQQRAPSPQPTSSGVTNARTTGTAGPTQSRPATRPGPTAQPAAAASAPGPARPGRPVPRSAGGRPVGR